MMIAGALRVLVVCGLLLALSIVDAKTRRLPNRLIALIFAADWSFEALIRGFDGLLLSSFAWSLVGGAAVCLLLLLVSFAAQSMCGFQALGGGDVKLIVAFAAMPSTVSLAICLLIACLLFLVYARVRKLGRGDTLPFGPFLSFGYVFMMLCESILWS